MPIAAGACKARHLDAEDHSHVVESDLSDQALKARSPICACSRTTKVIIDHEDPFSRPPERDRAFRQTVLEPSRLLVLEDLLHRRLTDIHDGQALQVARDDLMAAQRNHSRHGRHRHFRDHREPPFGCAARSLRARRPSVGAVPGAAPTTTAAASTAPAPRSTTPTRFRTDGRARGRLAVASGSIGRLRMVLPTSGPAEAGPPRPPWAGPRRGPSLCLSPQCGS